MNALRYTRANIPKRHADTSKWGDLNAMGIQGLELKRANVFQEAINRYLRGESIASFLAAEGIEYEQVLRALNRCLVQDAEGRIFGWVGLLLHVRLKSYERTAPVVLRAAGTRGGYAGALQDFLRRHPSVAEDFVTYCLTGKRGDFIPESRVSKIAAHRHFLTLCEKAQVKPHEWPFCTNNKGRNTIDKFVDKLHAEHFDDVVRMQYGERAFAKAKTGQGYRPWYEPRLPNDCWQADEHSAQFLGCIEIETSKGARKRAIGCVSIVAIADPAVPSIVGYAITFFPEPSEEHMADAFDSALTGRTLDEFALPGMRYTTGAGFPARVIPQLRGCACAVLMIDNHSRHKTLNLLNKLTDILGCAIVFGPIGRFECRAFIESVFSALERVGFMRVPSTTGSGPQDPLRQAAEEAAMKFSMTPRAILDLVEGVLANFNATNHSGSFGDTSLEDLMYTVEDPKLGYIPPKIPWTTGEDSPFAYNIVDLPVAGDEEQGGRPYVQYKYAKYTNPELASRPELIGKTIRCVVRRSNVRTIDARILGGLPLGTLIAKGFWGRSDHSLHMRNHIYHYLKARNLRLTDADDPVVIWIAALEAECIAESKKGVSISRAGSGLAEAQRLGMRPSTTITQISGGGEIPSASEARATFARPLPESIDAVN